jgi:hypothetical protein
MRGAIDAMRSEGYSPTVILAPIDWRLSEEAGLDVAAAVGTPPGETVPFGLPERARHRLRGTVAGLPLLTWRTAPANELIVVDLAQLGRWHQWATNDEGNELNVALTFYDESTARAMAEDDLNLLADDDHTTVSERALRLRNLVRVRATEAWTIEISDRRAGRRIVRQVQGGLEARQKP